jgi:signal transduction histidine kinase
MQLGFSQVDQNRFTDLKQKSKDYRLTSIEREKYGKQALELAQEIGTDSLVLSARKTLSLIYLDQENYDLYTQLSRQNLAKAEQISDTLSVASAYLNLGQSHYFQYQNDSAYYYFSKSLKFYQTIKNANQQGFILSAISDIQNVEQDYIGSEESAIQAIRIYETLPRNDYNLSHLWSLNNVLGIISLKLGAFDKSLEYHDIAESVSDEMSNGFYNKIFSINNKAFVYREKENYKEALKLYKSLIDIREDYDEYDPTFYPLVLDNYAYTRLVAGYDDYGNIQALFNEAFSISNRLNDPIIKLQVSIDVSKFYLQQKQQDSSLKYANISYKLAKETSSNEILLDALKVLSELKEGEDGKAYLNEHIKLSDSLLHVERNVRNKFARIEFETDKIEEANEKMSQQLIWLLVISGGLLITLFFLYIIVKQREKNKELKFEKDQQKANEDIYNLMLLQQDKVDEARASEKKRISKELHDGILGRLFGTRLSLDSFNFSEGKDAISKRATYITELKVIEDDIRKVSHDLSTDFVSGSGFMDIVSELIEKQTNAYQLQSHFDFTDDIHWEMVPNKTKINIYRIIQESLQNIYKHANAKMVKISVELKNSVICLLIVDDGDGFNISKSKKGIGIKNINSRVEEVKGNAQFRSEANKGTEVIITIPYKN